MSATGAYLAPTTTGSYLVVVRDASGAHADTCIVTINPTTSGQSGFVAGDDFTQYSGTGGLQSSINAQTLYNDNANTNLVSLDNVVTFAGHPSMMYTFPGGSSAAPQLAAPIKPLADMWLRYTVRWSAGFTTTGILNGTVTAANPTGASTSNAYKFVFFAFNEYDGRSGVELTNTSDYISFLGYTPRGANPIFVTGSPGYRRVVQEWSDQKWYDYVLHYVKTGPQTSTMKFWIVRPGTAPELVSSASLTSTSAQYPTPMAAKIILGRNFNQTRAVNSPVYLWVGRWEVYDGSVNPSPFGFN